MSANIHSKLIDVTWVLLLGATFLLWWVFDGASQESNAALLMTIMVIKSTLIAVVFMDLWRASKWVLGLLIGTMAATGAAILLLGSL